LADRVLSDYESQQGQLREDHDFDAEEIQVNLEIPEINPEIYKDMEPLLFQGFLTVPASINGVDFVFKSLNHHEYNRLAMYRAANDPVAMVRHYNRFLAYGVLLVDGRNMLTVRDSNIPELVEFFEGVNREARQKVIRHLSEINRRATRAIVLTEAYFIEAKSRLRWAQTKGLDLSSPAITGFQGTQDLGLNWAQLTWRALNYFEDLKEQAEREWENTKFVASAMAGKGMNKIYSQDKRRRQSERDQKVERREKIIRYALLNEPLEGSIQGPVRVARTVEELSHQLEKDLRGEQDWHDKVISDHENRIHQGYQDRMDHVRQLREEHIEKYGDRAIIATTEIGGLNPKDVQKRIKARQEAITKGLVTQSRFPELVDEKTAKFADKWMSQKPTVQSAPSVIPAQAPQRPRAKPFNGGK